MRDGKPLPGITPEQLLSQLAWRTLGPLRPIRIRAVMDYHGLRGAPAATKAQIAARYDTTNRTVFNWIAAGTRVLTGALHGDVGIVVVDDGLGVERPRPVVVGGALVVMAAGSSSM